MQEGTTRLARRLRIRPQATRRWSWLKRLCLWFLGGMKLPAARMEEYRTWSELELLRALVITGLHLDAESYEQVLTLFRLVLIITILLLFPWIGGHLFETVDMKATADWFHSRSPYFRIVPDWLIYIFHWRNLRYAIAPLAAIFYLFASGGYYVSDIFNLKRVQSGISYVRSSMLGIQPPKMEIENAAKVIGEGEENLLDAIGGPGSVQIQPGNVVMFRSLLRVTGASVTSSYFMSPFESTGTIANVFDQEGYKEELTTTTRDGIRVNLRDVRFRFKMISDPRTAMVNITNNIVVEKTGDMEPWRDAVKRSVTGLISDFINENTVDALTAPRGAATNPRERIASQLAGLNERGLRNIGAELIWIDVGHIDILDEDVDRERVKYWAADWEGEISENAAVADARHLAYQELGRAEAQAEMIMAITQAIHVSSFESDSRENIRKILLTRTSQILQAYRDTPKEKD